MALSRINNFHVAVSQRDYVIYSEARRERGKGKKAARESERAVVVNTDGVKRALIKSGARPHGLTRGSERSR